MAIIYNPPEWTAGDTESLQYRITDEFGAAIDITGYTGTMQVRSTFDGALIATSTGVLNVDDSTITYTFPPLQTANFRSTGAGNYLYDAETVSPNGVTTTDVRGTIAVVMDITRAAAAPAGTFGGPV